MSEKTTQPNWPSKKEGQESGKGRTNNPPGPNKTPPPAPKEKK